MAYQLHPDESIDACIRRIVTEECAQVRKVLPAARPNEVDAAIHASRKALKRLRALMRIVRPALGGQVFRREDQFLRQLARRLAAPRDTFVAIRTWDRVVAELDRDQSLSDGDLPDRIRGTLVVHYLEAVETTVHEDREPDRVAEELDLFEARVIASPWWPFDHGDLMDSLRTQYERCRKLWRKVRRKDSERNAHRWRREAKYFMHHVQLLSPLDPKRFGRMARRLDEFVEALGEEHDLAVLVNVLDKDAASFTDTADMKAIKATIGEKQKSLRKQAMKAGSALFRQKPRRLKLAVHHPQRK